MPLAQSLPTEHAFPAARGAGAGQVPVEQAAPVDEQILDPHVAPVGKAGDVADTASGAGSEQRLFEPLGSSVQSSRQVMKPNCFMRGSMLQRVVAQLKKLVSTAKRAASPVAGTVM